jgi:large subunit ribosomal protein L33
MAKKSKRFIINLQCSDCKSLNYTKRISSHDPQRKKLELQKYCKKCQKHTIHKETKIAKAKKK